MASIPLYTYQDMVGHLIDWVGGNPSAEARRDARRSVLDSLRAITTEHQWSYFYRPGRIITSQPYRTGTISYQHTGGTFAREMTLSGGTWPTWAQYAWLVINNVPYEVSSRKSDSVLTLGLENNPGQDVPAGATYTLYRDAYPLPTLCRSVGEVILSGLSQSLSYERPDNWMLRRRCYHGEAQPVFYTIFGSQDFLNTLQVVLFPPPDQVYPVDFMYTRRPRPLQVEEYTVGRVATLAGSVTVTGTGTGFSSHIHPGTIFRVSRTADAVTSPWGSNPSAFDRVVLSVESPTSLTLDDVVPETFSNARYVLSDPIDVEDGAMLTLLLRAAEKHMGFARNKGDRDMLEQEYNRALIRAREADSRSYKDELVGASRPYPVRMADMPIGPDQL